MFIFKLIVGLVINMAFFGGLLFLPARTWEWWRAWVFLGVLFIAYVATMAIVFPGKEELLDERFKPPIQEGQPTTDKVWYPAYCHVLWFDRLHSSGCLPIPFAG
jgi:hypothetical protein